MYAEIRKRPMIRRPQIETLECRCLLAADPFGRNLMQPFDVNRDGLVSALDALRVINGINFYANSNGYANPSQEELIGSFLDVSGDEKVSAIDALMIINRLNSTDLTLAATVPHDGQDVMHPEWAFDLRVLRYDLVLHVAHGELSEEPVAIRIGNGPFRNVEQLFVDRKLVLSESVVDEIHGDILADGDHEIEVRYGADQEVLRFVLTLDRQRPSQVIAPAVAMNGGDSETIEIIAEDAGGPTTLRFTSQPADWIEIRSEIDGRMTVDLRPTLEDDGFYAFEVEAIDAVGLSTKSVFEVNVGAASRPPTLSNEPLIFTAIEDRPLEVQPTFGLLPSEHDDDLQPIIAILRDAPAHGSVEINSDGSFAYRAVENYSGLDEFTYVVSDGQAESNKRLVQISIEPENDKPIFRGLTRAEETLQVSVHGGTIQFGILAEDHENDPIEFSGSFMPWQLGSPGEWENSERSNYLVHGVGERFAKDEDGSWRHVRVAIGINGGLFEFVVEQGLREIYHTSSVIVIRGSHNVYRLTEDQWYLRDREAVGPGVLFTNEQVRLSMTPDVAPGVIIGDVFLIDPGGVTSTEVIVETVGISNDGSLLRNGESTGNFAVEQIAANSEGVFVVTEEGSLQFLHPDGEFVNQLAGVSQVAVSKNSLYVLRENGELLLHTPTSTDVSSRGIRTIIRGGGGFLTTDASGRIYSYVGSGVGFPNRLIWEPSPDEERFSLDWDESSQQFALSLRDRGPGYDGHITYGFDELSGTWKAVGGSRQITIQLPQPGEPDGGWLELGNGLRKATLRSGIQLAHDRNIRTLTVTGTNAADRIKLNTDLVGSRRTVRLMDESGEEFSFSGRDVVTVEVSLRGGDDIFTATRASTQATSPNLDVSGGTGHDTIIGSNGDDILRGDSGMDTLSGGAGDDQLDGGADDDILSPGIGADLINGGSERDVFRLNSSDPSKQLFLQFDGASISRAELDRWSTTSDWNPGVPIPSSQSFIRVQPFDDSIDSPESIIFTAMQEVHDNFAGFGFDIIRLEPGMSAIEGIGATTVFVGPFAPNAGIILDVPGELGRASTVEENFNPKSTDIAFVFGFAGVGINEKARFLGNIISHEAAHTFGVRHVQTTAAGDLMRPGAGNRLLDLDFVDTAIMRVERDSVGNEEFLLDRQENTFSQNSHMILRGDVESVDFFFNLNTKSSVPQFRSNTLSVPGTIIGFQILSDDPKHDGGSHSVDLTDQNVVIVSATLTGRQTIFGTRETAFYKGTVRVFFHRP